MTSYTELFYKLNNTGDVLFLSNKIFRIPDAVERLDSMYSNIDLAVPYLFPIFELLKDGKNIYIVLGNKIVDHPGFSNGVTWDFNRVALSMKEIINYNSGLPWNEHKKFSQTMMFDWKSVVIYYLARKKLPYNYKTFLMDIYYCFYKYVKPFPKKVMIGIIFRFLSCKWIYNSIVYTHNNLRRLKGKNG